MRWTADDIDAFLEDGWELDEIAAATELGIAEVKRLLREQRYKKRKKIQHKPTNERIAMVASQEEQEEVTAEVRESSAEEVDLTAHTPQSSISLSAFDGAPSCTTIEKRGKSSHPKWAHYRHAPVEELEGDFTSQLRTAFWIDEGTTFEPLEVSKSPSKKPAPAPAKAKVAAPPEVNLADKAAQIALLERELAASRSKVEDLEASLEDAKGYCDERDDRIEALEEDVARWKHLARDAQREIDETRATLAGSIEHLDLSESNLVEAAQAVSRRLKLHATKPTTRTDDVDHYMRRAHQAEDTLQRIAELAERHTLVAADDLGTDELLETVAAAFEGSSKASKLDKDLLSIRQLVREQTNSARWLKPDDLHRQLAATFEKSKELEDEINQCHVALGSEVFERLGYTAPLDVAISQRIKELEQQLAAHRNVSSSMVGLEQPSAPDTPIEWQEKLNALGEKTGLIIMKASRQQAEHIEALLSQGFDLVQALEQEGVHLPVEARAWLWDVSRVEGAA